MIRLLKLRNAVYAIILGILALIAAQIMSSQRIEGSKVVLAIAGILMIVAALLFLFPIIFAKKVETDEKNVELKPVPKLPVDKHDVA